MTRINVVSPELLTNEWLVAEYRELPRIPNKIRGRKYSKDSFKNIPLKYLLGSGHERFFIDKLKYLEKRHARICAEMDKRGINRTNNPISCSDLPGYNDYNPTSNDIKLNVDRLKERFSLRKRAYHYYSQTINDDFVFNTYIKFVFEHTSVLH